MIFAVTAVTPLDKLKTTFAHIESKAALNSAQNNATRMEKVFAGKS